MNALDKITAHLNRVYKTQYKDCIAFLAGKIESDNRSILNPRLSPEKRISRFVKTKSKPRLNCIYWLALNQQWDLVRELHHALFSSMYPNGEQQFVSRKSYEKWRRRLEKEAMTRLRHKSFWTAGNLFNGTNNVEVMRTKIVPELFGKYGEYGSPQTLNEAIQPFYKLITLGMIEEAERYWGLIESRWPPDRTPKEYIYIEHCLMCLMAAQSQRKKSARKEIAAMAIVDALTSVMENWSSRRTERGDTVLSYDLGLAANIFIDYEFDPKWSVNCFKSMLWLLHITGYHAAVLRAFERDIWLLPVAK